MNIQNTDLIVLSVGGSMIVPDKPNVAFITIFAETVRRVVHEGKRLIIVVGGGKTAREYIEAADQISDIAPDDLDWLGIHATRLNAHLLRTVLRDVAHPVVVKNPLHTPSEWEGSVLIGAGWKPGWSTDYVAARMAEQVGANSIVNISNIDYVYNQDPRKHPDAQPLQEITWHEYRKMVGDEWSPGKSAPFDPIASKFCQDHGMEVAIIAADAENIQSVLLSGTFEGTLIS